MFRMTRLAGAGITALAVAALTTAPARAATQDHQLDRGDGAVFVQTDSLTANAVIAYRRDRAGALHAAGSYSTGGVGGHLTGAVVDNTASQGALTLDRGQGLLYVVNAGSDTFTVFAANGAHLSRLAIVSSHGSFPVSIAAHGDTVYVLNARAGGSIQGFRWRNGHLTATSHRELGLDPSLTPEFTHTPGQVAITPDGDHVVVTTKAGANTIDVFQLAADGRIEGDATVSDQAGKVPFAIAFDPRGRLVIANAGDSSVTSFRIAPNGRLTQLDSQPTGQAATCWVVASGHLLYASNAGSASLSGFRIAVGGALTALGNTTTDAGTVDATVSSDGRTLYVQAGAAGIVDGFAIGHGGSLTALGSVTVPDAVGAEGIAAS